MTLAVTEYRTDENQSYERVIKDLRPLIEQEKAKKTELLQLKHRIGTRLLALKAATPYGEVFDLIKRIAAELNTSWQDLYAAMRFAEKYPIVEDFLKGKFDVLGEGPHGSFLTRQKTGSELTWHEVCHQKGILLSERPKASNKDQKKRIPCLLGSDECAGEVREYSLCGMHLGEFEVWLNRTKPEP